MIPRIREEKFLHLASEGKVLRRGSVEDCTDPLLCTKHHNDSYNKRREVPTSWKCGKGPTQWKRRRLYGSIVVCQAPQ